MKTSTKAMSVRTAALLAAVSGIAFSTPSMAQQAATASVDATQPVSADSQRAASEPAAGIEEIVVTARRSSENVQRVPIAITTITARGLRDLTVRDVVDIQKVTPGLYIQSNNSGGRARLTIRGQGEADSRLTTDGSVGVYIDSVNIARSYGLRTSLVDIAQIEVLKGPQGTLFGKNTTGGALNITTQHPTYEWGGYVDMTYGSYNKAQAIAAINAPLVAEKLALRVVGQVTTREGYGTFFNGQDANNENTVYGRALLRADPAENVHILLSSDYTQQWNNGRVVVLTLDNMLQNANTATGTLGAIAKELGLNPASAADRLTAYNAWRVYYDAYQTGSRQTSFSRPPSGQKFYDNFTHYGFSGNVAVELGGVTARSITAYRVLNQAFNADSDATPFELLASFSAFRTRNFSQEFQLSSIDKQGLDWQVGVYYNRERGSLINTANTLHYVSAANARIENVDSVVTSKAAYAQAVMNFTPTFRATGGIRYTRDIKEINSHNRTDPAFALAPSPAIGTAPSCALLTPTLGGPVFPNCNYATSVTSNRATWLASLDWRPVPEVMLYASVSTGYRAGGFTQQANNSVLASVAALQAAFTPFEPEDIRNYETGFKSDLFDRHLRVNGSAFYQDYRNIQVTVRDVVNGLLVNLIRNGAKAKLYGGELEVTAEPVSGFTLRGSLAYLHARYDSFVTRTSAGVLVDLTAQPFSAPKWTYNIGAAYDLPLSDGSLRFNANYAYTGTVNLAPGQPGALITVYDPAPLTQHGYGLLDARIAWEIASQGLEVAVYAKNLTNKYYFLQASNGQSQGFDTGTPGDPRTFGIQVRKSF